MSESNMGVDAFAPVIAACKVARERVEQRRRGPGVVWTYPGAESAFSYLDFGRPEDECGAPSPGDVCRYCDTVHRAAAPKRADGPRVSIDGWAAEARALVEDFRDGFTMLVIAPDGTRYADPSGPARARPSQQDLLMEIARIRNLAP